MRILHILDHSLPLQSGYAFRTMVNQQRALGWAPILLTSGKRRDPPGNRSANGNFCGRRTQRGFAGRLPWVRELKIVTDLDRRLDEVIQETRPQILHAHSPVLNALAAIRAGRRYQLPVVYEVHSLWEEAPTSHGTRVEAILRYRATRRLET